MKVISRWLLTNEVCLTNLLMGFGLGASAARQEWAYFTLILIILLLATVVPEPGHTAVIETVPKG